jgi:hypothetical protein
MNASPMTVTRKDFLQSLAGLGAGAFVITILPGCTDHDDPEDEDGVDSNLDTAPVACTPNAFISANHGHSVIVFRSHVIEGVERQYSIQGTSTHRHFITVTAAMFDQLRQGNPVTVRSGGTTHTHDVTLACVPFCDRSVQISANHGHALVVPFTHVAYGTERQYSIQGTSTHRHFITVTAENFATLRNNQPITVESGGVTHTHFVTINCVLPPPPCSPKPIFSANHGHILAMTTADIEAGVDHTYNVQGTANHSHTVLITAQMFAQLQANMPVQTITMGNNHIHNVSISCVSSVLEGGLGSLSL